MAKDYKRKISGLLDESGELRTEFKYTPLKENILWNPETFKKGYDGHSILEKANVKEYSNLMLGDDSLLRYPAGDVLESKTRTQENSLEGLLLFGKKNSKELGKLALEHDKQAFANSILNSPLFKIQSYAKKNYKFNDTVEDVINSREELILINKDQNDYLNKKLMGITETARAFYAPFADNLISEYKNFHSNFAVESIDKFGFPKFASINLSNAYDLGERQKKEMKKIFDKAQNSARNLGDNPKKEELEKIEDKLKKEGKKVAEKYENALEAWPALTMELMKLARPYLDSQEYSSREKYEKKTKR
tara:strand:- start:5157 stop:6074 length:918 start_codon:yes stop_codon:yes gene_type:complete